MAVLGIGVPGRHPLLLDDFADHLGPADDLVIARQRERADLAGPMAPDAAVLQDAGDLFGVGHFAVGLRRDEHAADVAADGLGVAA